jgi:two-component system response regulator DevR
MRAHLGTDQRDLEQAVARLPREALQGLFAATNAIAGVLDLDRVLQRIVDTVRDLISAHYAALGIVGRDGRIERFITSGIDPETRRRLGDPPSGHGLLGVIIREGRSLRIPDIKAHPGSYGFPPGHPRMTSLLGVPITVHGQPIGNFYLTDKQGADEFSEDDQVLVEMFALRAGIAIDNARLHDQVQRLAVVEERERIGRDLHDGIIQGIYAVALSLEDVPDLVDVDRDEAMRRVDHAIDSLNLSIRDIRNFILGLQSEFIGGADLPAGLATLAREFELNTAIDIRVDVGGGGARGRGAADERAGQPPPDGPRGVEQRRAALRRRRRFDPADRGGRRPRDDDRGRRRRLRRVGRPRVRSPWAHQPDRARRGDRRERSRRQRARTGHAYHRPRTRPVRQRRGALLTDAPTPPKVLRLLVVDDHEVVRQGLVALLDRREGFQVVAEAGSVAEALDQARRFQPEIVVLDVRLPDGSGIEACREIRSELPQTRVVMLTSYPDEEAVLSAIVAGASGYLLKQIRARDLVAALEAVGRGESLLDPAVTEKVLERVRRIASGTYTDELAQLTAQEQKILLLVAEGKTNKEIASDIFLSDKTVKNYVSSILSKLNLERRAQAAAFVAKHRIDRGG